MMTVLTFAALAVGQLSLQAEEFQVDGVRRTALVHIPKNLKGAPVVFGFHGHGGNSRNAARSFDLHRHWPNALVIYPQGLATKTPNDPNGNRPGWQYVKGTDQDRDLKFFDSLVDWSRRKSASAAKVFVMGHSNGGSFTYLLWEQRASKLAAVAPAGAIFTMMHGITAPKPCLLIAGKTDAIVNPDRQLAGHERAKKLNGAKNPGRTWNEVCTWFDGIQPTVTYVFDGGHQYPALAGKLTAEFFKQIAKEK